MGYVKLLASQPFEAPKLYECMHLKDLVQFDSSIERMSLKQKVGRLERVVLQEPINVFQSDSTEFGQIRQLIPIPTHYIKTGGWGKTILSLLLCILSH